MPLLIFLFCKSQCEVGVFVEKSGVEYSEVIGIDCYRHMPAFVGIDIIESEYGMILEATEASDYQI